METEVKNNIERQRFEIKLGEEYAFSEYRLHHDRYYFIHTEVPPQFEGQGIASKLIKFALDEVVKQGKQIVPWCRFVAAYIQRHQEYQEHVYNDAKS